MRNSAKGPDPNIEYDLNKLLTAIFKILSKYKNFMLRPSPSLEPTPITFTQQLSTRLSETTSSVLFLDSQRVRWTLCWPLPLPKGYDRLGTGVFSVH